MKPAIILPLAALASAAFNWDVYRIGTVLDFLWRDPLPADGGKLNGYTSCETTAHFNGTQYKLSDLRVPPPAGLEPWADGVEALFTSRFYPGSWQGVNYKGEERDVVMMEWRNVPAAARAWVEEQLADEEMRSKRFMVVVGRSGGEASVEDFPVDERLLIIAPGELYNFLPLWASEKAECEDKLNDLSKYTPNLQDDAVIAWAKPLSLPDRATGGRDVSFSVDAWYIRETEDGRAARVFWEKAHAMANRHFRKQVREERIGKRALTQAQRADKDEL